MSVQETPTRPRWVRELFVPTHWSFLLGPVAVICFVVLLLTGLVLTFFYQPSTELVEYDGSAALYAGRELPAAFSSVVTISEDVPGGLLLRRVHRAASYLFVATLLLHFLRVLLAGAFRGRRFANYLVGLVLLALALALGWTGQNLVYDVVTGSSVRIGYSIAASIPYVGGGLADLVFAGPDVDDVVPRLFWLHVLILPVLFVLGLAVHLWLVVRHRHTVLPRRREAGGRLVVAVPSGVGLRSRAGLLAALVCALLVLAGTLVPFGDVTHIGPFLPGVAGNDMYPDWYLFPMEGAILLLPAVEFAVLGATITNPLLGGVLLPAVLGGAALLYPLLELLFRRRRPAELDLHEHPFHAPARVAFVTLLVVPTVVTALGAASDVIAQLAGMPVADVIRVLRVAFVTAPPVLAAAMFWYARRRSRQLTA
ncbi:MULTISPECIES: cytochrome b N-terminal domain-containing protein [unclassified Modestobacter]